MKWLVRLIKRTFAAQSKSSPQRKVDVPYLQLSTYLSQHLDERFESAKEKIIDELHGFKTLQDELRELLKNLEIAQLQNEQIPEHAKQIMEGNRKTYLQRHQALADLHIPESPKFEEVVHFINSVEKELELIKTNTAKNHLVLNEFFKNELEEINGNLAAIEETNKRFRELCAARPDELRRLEMAQKEVDEFMRTIKTQQALRKNLQEMEQNLGLSKEEREELIARIERHKKNPEFTQLADMENLRTELNSQIQKLQDEFRQKFLPLDKPLRKYAYDGGEGKDLVENYLDNPLKALTADKHHVILQILAKVRKMVETDQIEVKDASRVLAALDSLTSTYLRHVGDQYEQLADKKLETEKKLRLSNAMRNYDEMMYRLSHIDQKLERYTKEIEEGEKKLKRNDLEEMRSKLQNSLSDVLQTDLTISM